MNENIFTKNDYNLNINEFFSTIKFKKQYLKTLKQNIFWLKSIKDNNYNYKDLNLKLFPINNQIFDQEYYIAYIIDISFLQTNTFLSVMDSSGKLKYSCSAGSLKYKGKAKRNRFKVFKSFFKLLASKLTFLKNKPVALHLKNVRNFNSWIIKQLKKKVFIRLVREFNLYPHNGCRKPKVRRKKFRTKRKRR
jgi:ribosomal protein S11